jgi:hypothetical protein
MVEPEDDDWWKHGRPPDEFEEEDDDEVYGLEEDEDPVIPAPIAARRSSTMPNNVRPAAIGWLLIAAR